MVSHSSLKVEAVLVPEPGQFADRLSSRNRPLQEEEPLLSRRLSTQRHRAHDQDNGGAKNLHERTLPKRERRPEAPPNGPMG